MGRLPFRVKLTITLNEDDIFSSLETFNSIPEAAATTGFTNRGIRATYHKKKESLKKHSGEVYEFKWEEPNPICKALPSSRVKTYEIVKNCSKCSKPLTFKDKSFWFSMFKDGDYKNPMLFTSLYTAARKTGISIHALRNACEKANPMIM